jgi:hypothetical protein
VIIGLHSALWGSSAMIDAVMVQGITAVSVELYRCYHFIPAPGPDCLKLVVMNHRYSLCVALYIRYHAWLSTPSTTVHFGFSSGYCLLSFSYLTSINRAHGNFTQSAGQWIKIWGSRVPSSLVARSWALWPWTMQDKIRLLSPVMSVLHTCSRN